MWGGVCLLVALVNTVSHVAPQPPNAEGDKGVDWVWQQLYVYENNEGPFPINIGKIHSNWHKPGLTRYSLAGDGAGTLFKVNPENGSISVYRKLDREDKSNYTLRAFVKNLKTNKPQGPPTEFIIRVMDINDNAPQFNQKVFKGSIPEMSPSGTFILTVTAHDKDDPTVGGHTKITYLIVSGGQEFTIEQYTGAIRVRSPDLDRDRDQYKPYQLTVQAKDMGTNNGGFSSTVTVFISLTDINDNPPRFLAPQNSLSVAEDKPVGVEVGRVKAKDSDEGENAEIRYTLIPKSDLFSITTDPRTQHGVIALKKPLDFEKRREYRLVVKADNPTSGLWTEPNDRTELLVTVLDVDEPPVFSLTHYTFSVSENKPSGTLVGQVKATDPDQPPNSILYGLRTGEKHFRIVAHNGSVFTAAPLDRELHASHNITVTATEIAKNGSVLLSSDVLVVIMVMDVNDNPPKLKEDYRLFICENQGPGSLVEVIAAVDADEMTPAVRFHFSLGTNDNNFTLSNNGDNTANLTVRFGGFNHKERPSYQLPIVVSDNGQPSLSSTGSLEVTVCACDQAGEAGDCRLLYQPLTSRVNLTVLLISFLFIILLIGVVVLILYQRIQQEKPVFGLKNPSEIQEQLVRYDEEGGGEMDTNSFDISVLNSLRARGGVGAGGPRRGGPIPEEEEEEEGTRRGRAPGPVYARVRKPQADMGCVVNLKKLEADGDQDLLPYDTLHVFGEEGGNSVAESLSSLGGSSGSSCDQDYDFLSDWGPRFHTLSELYGVGPHWGGGRGLEG